MTPRPIGQTVRWSIAALLLGGCGDLAHVNPYDPAAPFEITLTGPTTAQVGDTLTFTVETKPRWTRTQPPEWSSLDSRVLYPLGGGRYVAMVRGTATIEVRFGPRLETRDVTVQSPALTSR
jgi:hypothetical protein